MSAAAFRAQNPFPGLRPFKTDEATLFFGRDDQIGEALDRMMRQKLLAVVGVSGCGKSSLVTAGMVPALEMGLAGDPEQHWRIATMRPGDGPLRELARCLGFGEALAERTYGLLEAVETHLPAGENLLLVVDQFEEIFPFRDRKLLAGGGSEADLFVSYLLRAAQDLAGRVYVLLTMRSDYLGECAKFHGLPEALNDGQYLVPRMTRQQLQEAIEGPLQAAGVTMHPSLVQELLNQCDEEPDNLPLLQHLLRRMFEEWEAEGDAEGPITPTIAKSVGGLAKALDQDAEQKVCSVLSSEELRVAEIVFRRITESRGQSDRREEDRPVRRPQTVADLAKLARVKETALLDVVRRFEERGLLVVRDTDQGAKVDLPHECVCLHWARLKEWIRAESEDAKKLRFLWDATERKAPLSGLALDEALEWERNGRLGEAWCSRYLSLEQVTAVAAWVAESHRYVTETAERERESQEGERRREEEKRILAEEEVRREAERRAAETRSRRVKVAALVLLLLTVAFGVLGAWAYQQSVLATGAADKATSETARAMAAREEANAQEKEALKQKDLAKESERIATETALAAAKSERKAVAEAERAEANYRQYLAAQLALQSAEVFREDPPGLEKAVRLAIESMRLGPTLAGDEALRQSLSLLPKTQSVLWKKLPEGETAVAMSPDAKWLAKGGSEIVLIEAATGTTKKLLPIGDEVRAVAVSFDGKRVAVGGKEIVRVLDVATGKDSAQVRHPSSVSAVAFSPDGKWVATGSDDKTARVMDVATNNEVARFPNVGTLGAVAFSPDGKWLATGSDDRTARVMEIATNSEVARFPNLGKVGAVAFSQDGKWLATGSDDKTMRVMEVAEGTEVTRLPHQGEVRAVAFTPDGKQVRTWSSDGTARVMDAPSARQMVRLQNDNEQGKEVEANTAAFSPDGKLVATGSVDNLARVMEVATGRVLRTSPDYKSQVFAVAFSPDGKLLTTRTEDMAAWVMETTKKGNDRQGRTDQRVVYSVAFSPDGSLLATGGKDKLVMVTDLAKERVLKIDPKSEVYGVAFSPDGKWLVTGGADGTARLWDSATGAERKSSKVSYPRGRVYATAFSTDGKWLATGRGSSVKVTEVASGRELYHIEIGTGIFVAARFSQDGHWLETIYQVSETDKNLIYARYPLGAEELIRAACGKLTRNLTKEEWEQEYPKEIKFRRQCENWP